MAFNSFIDKKKYKDNKYSYKFIKTMTSDQILECTKIIDVLNYLEEIHKRGPYFYIGSYEKFNLYPVSKILNNLSYCGELSDKCSDELLVTYVGENLYPQIDNCFETLMRYMNIQIKTYYNFLDAVCSNIDHLMYMQEIHTTYICEMIKTINILPSVLMNIVIEYISYDEIDFKMLLNLYKYYRYKFSTGHRVAREDRNKFLKRGVVMRLFR